MDPEERKKLIEAIKAAIAEDNGPLAARLDALEQTLAGLGDRPSLHRNGGPDPFAGEAFLARVKALHDGALNTGKIPLGIALKAVKALVSGDPNESPSTTYPTQPERGPTIPPTQRPLMLLDMLTPIPVSSNTYEHVQISRTNNAAVQQGEGVAKAETEINTALVTCKIATVAHHTTASRQVLSDNVQLIDILRQVLALDCLDKLERLILNGNGTTDEILGLIEQAIVLDVTETHPADRISEASAMMWDSGYVASALVVNPLDWHTIRTERASGDGQYVAGGWANPAAPTVWSVPLVQTPSIALGSALLVDTSRVRLLDREQASVMISTEHESNFTKNLATLLGELRAGVAVYDTSGLGVIDLGTASP